MPQRRKTNAEKLAQGDTRKVGRKKLDAQLAAAPKVQTGLVCPAHLQGDAAALFAFFAEQLELSGLDAKPDSQALAVAAESLARAWKAARMLKRQGEVRSLPVLAGIGKHRKVVGHKQVRNRWFGVLVESQRMFDRIASKFGLVGPVSRAGLEIPHAAKPVHGMSSQLWEMLNAPRKPRVKPPEQIAWEAQQAREAQAAKEEPPKEPVQ